MGNELRLEVPGDSLYAFAPRVVAAWLVAGTGAEIDAVEDARLAIDELVGPFVASGRAVDVIFEEGDGVVTVDVEDHIHRPPGGQDRKSTRLNSRHQVSTYAVF